MARKVLKGILIFGGLAVATAAMAVFALNFLSQGFVMAHVFIVSLVVAAGVIVSGAGLMLHGRDIWERKHALGEFCRILAIFWFVSGGVNIVASTVLLIVL
jgi:hypothetical protein